MEHASGAHESCFAFDADADFCTSSWLFWRWGERGQVSNLRFSYYISLVFLSTGTGRLGLLNWVGWSRCCASTPRRASAVTQGPGLSCAMQVAQDYVCKMLCGSLSSPACGLLGKLFTPSCCYFGLWLFPRSLSRESWGRKKHPGRQQWWWAFSVCLTTCPAAAPEAVEVSWSVEVLVGLQTAGSRNVCHFLLHFLFPPSYLRWLPKIVSPKTCCTCNWWGVSLVFIFL